MSTFWKYVCPFIICSILVCEFYGQIDSWTGLILIVLFMILQYLSLIEKQLDMTQETLSNVIDLMYTSEKARAYEKINEMKKEEEEK